MRRLRAGPALLLAALLGACGDVQLDFFEEAADSVRPETPGSGGGSSGLGGADPVDEVEAGAGGTPEAGGASPLGGADSGPAVPAPPVPAVLVIVDEVPISTDDVVQARLEALGAEVTRISELLATPETVQGYDLIVVTPSADRVDFSKDLQFVDTPMISLEPAVSTKMGLGQILFDQGQSELLIVEPSHPIVAGMTSPLAACTSSVALQGNTLKASGVSLVDSPSAGASLVFVYPAGVDIGAGVLPALRIGVSAVKLANCQTEVSWRLFDRAVEFALSD